MPRLLGNANLRLQAAPAPPAQTPAPFISLGHKPQAFSFPDGFICTPPAGNSAQPAAPAHRSQPGGRSVRESHCNTYSIPPSSGSFQDHACSPFRDQQDWCSCAAQSLLLIFLDDKIRIKILFRLPSLTHSKTVTMKECVFHRLKKVLLYQIVQGSPTILFHTQGGDRISL